MILMLVFLSYYHYIRHINAKSLGFMAAIVILVLVTAYSLVKTDELYSKRLQNITNTTQDNAVGRRITYLIVGWREFIKAPFLGHGTGTFRELYSKTIYAAKYARKGHTLRRYAHNTYLEILIGTGITGLIIFLLVLRRAFKNFWVAAKVFIQNNQKNETEIIYAYIFSFASVSLYLLIFSDIYHKYMLLSIALSQIALRLSQQEKIENK